MRRVPVRKEDFTRGVLPPVGALRQLENIVFPFSHISLLQVSPDRLNAFSQDTFSINIRRTNRVYGQSKILVVMLYLEFWSPQPEHTGT